MRLVDTNLPDEFHIHVVTWADKTDYVADGHTIGGLSGDTFSVTIKAKKDSNIRSFDYLTPIVHTINLGEISFPNGDGFIEVYFDKDTGGATKVAGNGNKNGARTIDADEDARPIRD